MAISKPISIYIHWPFCLSLCPYCDFNSHLVDNLNVDLWIESYKKEIAYFKEKLVGRRIKSVFFGGGTPSLMDPKIPAAILEELSKYGQIDQDTEVTLEANPTSYEAAKFLSFKQSGINRVSIGVQSLNDDNLKFLGRKHSGSEALAVITSAADIFDNFSYDLIYALPGQSLEDWKLELQNAHKFFGPHISLYQLTIEKGTPFHKQHETGKFTLPSDDIAADMYEWTNKYLEAHGYHQYEISNYAKTGKECQHNITYWDYDEYIGIGPGAHSRLHQQNTIEAAMSYNSPNKWIESVKDHDHGLQYKRSLSALEIIKECVMMGTRLKTGLKEEGLLSVSGKNFSQVLNMQVVDEFQNLGLLNMQQCVLRLTDKGLILHNYLVPRLLLEA